MCSWSGFQPMQHNLQGWLSVLMITSSKHSTQFWAFGALVTCRHRSEALRAVLMQASAAAAAAAAVAQDAEPGDMKMESHLRGCRAESSGRSGAGAERRWAAEDSDVDSLRARLCSRRCQVLFRCRASTLGRLLCHWY